MGAQQEILRDYYQEKNQMGYDFAYRYPGMNKVLQAAGRVIRSDSDRGVVMLLDDRPLGAGAVHFQSGGAGGPAGGFLGDFTPIVLGFIARYCSR